MPNSYIPERLDKIDFADKAGLEYWLTFLGCSREGLFSALHDVGNFTIDVQNYLVITGRVTPPDSEDKPA